MDDEHQAAAVTCTGLAAGYRLADVSMQGLSQTCSTLAIERTACATQDDAQMAAAAGAASTGQEPHLQTIRSTVG